MYRDICACEFVNGYVLDVGLSCLYYHVYVVVCAIVLICECLCVFCVCVCVDVCYVCVCVCYVCVCVFT